MNNNKSAGTTAKSCDAILPIGGITENSYYKAAVITNSGGFFSEQPEPNTSLSYIDTPISVPITAALKPLGTFLANVNIHPTILTSSGQYRINPQFICPTSTASGTGGVNFIIYKTVSTFGTYVGTLTLGTSTVNPSIANLLDGITGFWQGQLMYSFGTGNSQITSNNNSSKSIYLNAATGYSMLVVCHTAITTTDTTAYVGFTEFNRIG